VINPATEHRLRLVTIGWYLAGWIPCLLLNGAGVSGKICLAIYAALGIAVYMVGMSIARELAERRDKTAADTVDGQPLNADESDRLRQIEENLGEDR